MLGVWSIEGDGGTMHPLSNEDNVAMLLAELEQKPTIKLGAAGSAAKYAAATEVDLKANTAKDQKTGTLKKMEKKKGLLDICGQSKPDPKEIRALHEALEKDKSLITKVAQIGHIKTSLLYTAARANNHPAVSYIISHGGQATAQNFDGNTAAHVAFYRANVEALDALCWHSPRHIKTNIKNGKGEQVNSVMMRGVSKERQEAINCLVRSSQWYIMANDCGWRAIRNQIMWEERFEKRNYEEFDDEGGIVSFADGVVTFPDGLKSPILHLIRVTKRAATVRVAPPTRGLNQWEKVDGVRHLTPVADLKLYNALEKLSTEQGGTSAVTIDGDNYNSFRPSWLYRNENFRWVAIDHNVTMDLNSASSQGETSFPTQFRKFDFITMSAIEKKTKLTTQLLHIDQPLPTSLDTQRLRSISAEAADRMDWLVRPWSDADLKKLLEGDDVQKQNLALIFIALQNLNCSVKGAAIRDGVIRGVGELLDGLDCDIVTKDFTVDDIEALREDLEEDFGLSTEFQVRSVVDTFSGMDSQKDDIFKITISSGKCKGVCFRLFSPHCDCFYPPQNVDATANNLCIRQNHLGAISQVVSVSMLPTKYIVQQILRNETCPAFDTAWRFDSTSKTSICEARANNPIRQSMMSERLAKIQAKKLKFVMMPVGEELEKILADATGNKNASGAFEGDLLSNPSFASNPQLNLPKYWNPSGATAANSYRVEVDTQTFENIKKHVSEMTDAAKLNGGFDLKKKLSVKHNKLTVDKVWRVQNDQMWEVYKVKIANILQDAVPGSVNPKCTLAPWMDTADLNTKKGEVYLFHGTDAPLVNVLATSGFDTRFSNMDGQYGAGTYFAEDCAKVDQYCTPDHQNYYYCILARVAMGKAYHIAQGQRLNNERQAPGPLTLRGKQLGVKEKHDSVIGKFAQYNFREFVIYDGNFAYPEYIIRYKREV